ncbi:MAG: hypothetical protein RL641_268 [Candidatus Parcubacteria bacterium]|jgi:hypothetical protein
MENTQQNKLSPKFFFLSLGVLVSLITSITAFLNLVFETLNFKFPDVLNGTYDYGYNSYTFDQARVFIAILIIFLPIFMVLMRYWKKTVKTDLSRIDEVVKKWMLYLIIFLAVLVAAIDLVTLVKYFVGGEITTRFIVKALVTLLVAKWVGYYYYFELKESKWKKLTQVFAPWLVTVASLTLIVWSFSVIGTPGEQRIWRIDEKRVEALSSIQSQVTNYFQQKQKLPEKLADLADPLSYFAPIPLDPEYTKGLVYEYNKTGNLSFELCATFSADMPKGWNEYGGGVMPMYSDVATSSYPVGGGREQSFDHGIGKKCFQRTIDPEKYKPDSQTNVAVPVKQ